MRRFGNKSVVEPSCLTEVAYFERDSKEKIICKSSSKEVIILLLLNSLSYLLLIDMPKSL